MQRYARPVLPVNTLLKMIHSSAHCQTYSSFGRTVTDRVTSEGKVTDRT